MPAQTAFPSISSETSCPTWIKSSKVERLFQLILDESNLKENKEKKNNVMDSLRFFSKGKNFKTLFALFLFLLLAYFDFFVFLFLTDKFVAFSIQYVNYATFSSKLIGFCFFSMFLSDAPRKCLNFTISGGLLVVSGLMVVASLLLDSYHLDVLGIISMCKPIIPSFHEDSRRLCLFLLLLVQRRVVSLSCSRLQHRNSALFLKHRQRGHSLLWSHH